VAKLILDDVVRLHGMPKLIVSDRDKIFISAFWKELFKLHDTSLLISTAYHPQSDGQTELVNHCLEMFLRYSIHNTPRQWKAWLSLAEFWYNTLLWVVLHSKYSMAMIIQWLQHLCCHQQITGQFMSC
jgi:hypothetical protein